MVSPQIFQVGARERHAHAWMDLQENLAQETGCSAGQLDPILARAEENGLASPAPAAGTAGTALMIYAACVAAASIARAEFPLHRGFADCVEPQAVFFAFAHSLYDSPKWHLLLLLHQPANQP